MYVVLGSIVVSIPACHAGGRGSIPRRGEFFAFSNDETSILCASFDQFDRLCKLLM